MAEKDRAKSRYGHKSKGKSKSHTEKDPSEWDHDDAKAYMNSKDGKDHMAKMQRAQELMQQQQPDQNAAPAAAPMPQAGAMPAPQGA